MQFLNGNKLNFTVVTCSWYSITVMLVSVRANEYCLGRKRAGATRPIGIRFFSRRSLRLA